MRIAMQAAVWMAVALMPLDGFLASGGCVGAGEGNRPRAVKTSRPGCCQSHSRPAQPTGCKCGVLCECGHSEHTTPIVPAPTTGQVAKDLSCQGCVVAVLPVAVELSNASCHGERSLSVHISTPPEICSTLCRFLL